MLVVCVCVRVCMFGFSVCLYLRQGRQTVRRWRHGGVGGGAKEVAAANEVEVAQVGIVLEV